MNPPVGFVINPTGELTNSYRTMPLLVFRSTFVFHRNSSIVWTARNSIFIYCIIWIFKTGSYIKRNVSLLEMLFFTKSIFSKKGFVKFRGIKYSISQKCFGIDQRMLFEKVFQSWDLCGLWRFQTPNKKL